MNSTVKKKKNKAPNTKQRKFNFVDFLLIVLVLAIIAGAVYLFSPGSFINKLGSAKQGTLSYTVEIQGVDGEYLNKIKENDVVVDSVSKNTLGTVAAVDYNTKQTVLEYAEQADGSYVGVLSEYPDQYTVLVTVTAPAEYVAGDGYFVNNCRIAVGEGLALRFPDFAAEGYCISLIPENFQ